MLPIHLARAAGTGSYVSSHSQQHPPTVSLGSGERALLTPNSSSVTTMLTADSSMAADVSTLSSSRVGGPRHDGAGELLTTMSLVDPFRKRGGYDESLSMLARTSLSARPTTAAVDAPNVHGEPVCYVSCSAATERGHHTAASGGDRDHADGSMLLGAMAAKAYEFAPLVDAAAAPPVEGLPLPHSMTRHSRRGLAHDTFRHELPLRELGRAGRAEQYLEAMREAGATFAGSGQSESVDAVRMHEAILTNQWTAVDRDTAERHVADVGHLIGVGGPHDPLVGGAAKRVNGRGFEVHTVTSTSKADRHGPNRYFHRNTQVPPHPSSGGLVANGPTNTGVTFAVGSELERNRLQTMQSRVLGPNGLVPSPSHHRQHRNHQTSGGALTAGADSASSASDPKYSHADFVEVAAMMGDMIEVAEQDFKITQQVPPSLRAAKRSEEQSGRVLRSQKEMARRFRLGGI